MYTYNLKFDQVPPDVYTGFFNETPFYIGLTTNNPDYENLQINLFSQNSNSSPFQKPQNKWSHLIPQWRFVNSKSNVIEFERPFLDTSKTQVSGTYALTVTSYYIDDMPGDVEIIAVLETSGLSLSSDNIEQELPSYANSLIYDSVGYEILSATPDHLKVTQDGKNKIDKFKWTNTFIPFVVTLHPSNLSTNIYGLTSVDPILFSEPRSNETFETSSHYLTLDVLDIPASSITWNDSSVVLLSAFDQYNLPSGGFYKGYFTPSVSSVPSYLVATYNNDEYGTILGVSNSFQIKNFERPYEMRRFNESWDAGSVIKSYALAEHTFSNPVFFDNFMEVSVGGIESSYQSIGRTLFERIANFVKNHKDIDISNVNQFYSILDEMDVPYDDYQLSYPSEVERLVDLLSIHKTRLLGSFCKCNRNFTFSDGECVFCGHTHNLNRTETPNNSDQFMVSAGVPFVIENNFSKGDGYRFDIIYPTESDLGGSVELLSNVPSVSWLTSSNYYKYSFYDYISSFCDVQEEGVINWSDPFTTLSSSFSSVEDWYGDEKLFEEILNYEIHRGLYNG